MSRQHAGAPALWRDPIRQAPSSEVARELLDYERRVMRLCIDVHCIARAGCLEIEQAKHLRGLARQLSSVSLELWKARKALEGDAL